MYERVFFECTKSWDLRKVKKYENEHMWSNGGTIGF